MGLNWGDFVALTSDTQIRVKDYREMDVMLRNLGKCLRFISLYVASSGMTEMISVFY